MVCGGLLAGGSAGTAGADLRSDGVNRSLRCCAWRCRCRAQTAFHSKRCRMALSRPSRSTACCLMVAFSNGGTRGLTWRPCARETAGKRVKPTGRAAARYVERCQYIRAMPIYNTHETFAPVSPRRSRSVPAGSFTCQIIKPVCHTYHLACEHAGLHPLPPASLLVGGRRGHMP